MITRLNALYLKKTLNKIQNIYNISGKNQCKIACFFTLPHIVNSFLIYNLTASIAFLRYAIYIYIIIYICISFIKPHWSEWRAIKEELFSSFVFRMECSLEKKKFPILYVNGFHNVHNMHNWEICDKKIHWCYKLDFLQRTEKFT